MSPRVLGCVFAMGLAACSGGNSKDGDDTGTDTAASGSDACRLAGERSTCDECADGEVTCSYGTVSETRMSCNGCQAEGALFGALCDAGEEADEATLLAGLVCEPASVAACELAQEFSTCDSCLDGDATCTFETTSVTTGSCGLCQVKGELYQELCDAGEPADRATLEAQTVCVGP